MEAAAEDERVRKALQKKPQARSKGDIRRLINKTQGVSEFVHGDPAPNTLLLRRSKLHAS